MRFTLPNGLVLEGTFDQVSQTARKLGYNPPMDKKIYHYSETKGEWVRIAEMDTKYLSNCLGKIIHANGALALINDEHFHALLTEYQKRENR